MQVKARCSVTSLTQESSRLRSLSIYILPSKSTDLCLPRFVPQHSSLWPRCSSRTGPVTPNQPRGPSEPNHRPEQ